MTALARIFFREYPTVPASAGAVIDWWESRRPIYNVAVGATGLVTLGVVNVTFALPPSPSPVPWVVNVGAALIYGVAANVCYSAGWAAELVLRRWIDDDSGAVGAALFRYGFAFSIGLTIFPAGLATLAWLARVAAAIL
jgi:hypothetical protein